MFATGVYCGKQGGNKRMLVSKTQSQEKYQTLSLFRNLKITVDDLLKQTFIYV